MKKWLMKDMLYGMMVVLVNKNKKKKKKVPSQANFHQQFHINWEISEDDLP